MECKMGKIGDAAERDFDWCKSGLFWCGKLWRIKWSDMEEHGNEMEGDVSDMKWLWDDE